MTVVIGLLGPAGAGKSTVADFLIEKYGAKLYSLAEPLKQIAMRVMGFTQDQCYGTQSQKEAIDYRYGFSPRTFMQKLGTEGIREVFGADIWTVTLLKKIKTEQPALAVVDDLRFINEACLFQGIDRDYPGLWGYVWRLRPPQDEEAYVRSLAAGKHISEEQWLQAPADIELSPKKRGIQLLLAEAEDACRSLNLFPKRPESPL